MWVLLRLLLVARLLLRRVLFVLLVGLAFLVGFHAFFGDEIDGADFDAGFDETHCVVG